MKPVDIERWQELEDLKYRASLVQCRIAAGLTQHDITVAMGRTHNQFVEAIESLTGEVHLSTLRRYAAAVGAVVRHSVSQVPAADADEPDSIDDSAADQ